MSSSAEEAGFNPIEDAAATDVLAAYDAAMRAGLSTVKCYCAGVEAWRRIHPDQTPSYSARQAVAVIQERRIELRVPNA